MRRAGRMTLWLVALSVVLAAPWRPATSADEQTARAAAGLIADPTVQADILKTVEALTAASGEAAQRQALADARALAGDGPGQRVRLLKQIEIFLAGAVGTEQAMGAAVMLHALEFDRQEIMAATLPHLVGAEPALHKVLREIAATAVDPGRDDDPIALVLEAERLRRSEGGEPAPDGRSASLSTLLERLEQDDSPWVRRYAEQAETAPDSVK